MFKNLLAQKNCFKLVLGAGNENIVQIARLIKFYYDLGCRFFDLGANPSIIEMGQKIAPEAYFCASFAVRGDRHIVKAKINEEKCTNCNKCKGICPNNALHISSKSCVGCGACRDICPNNAIEFYEPVRDFEADVIRCCDLGVDCIELHARSENINEIFEKWNFISEHFKGLMGVCLGHDDLKIAKKLVANKEPYTTIIQADGKSMSGTDDKIETTMPAIKCAKIYSDAKLPSFLIVSGGTNSKTYDLLVKEKIDFTGVAYGTYARRITNKTKAKALLEPFLKPQIAINKE